MIFWLDRHLKPLKNAPDTINQNGIDANIITVCAPFTADVDFEIAIQNANGYVLNMRPMTATGQLIDVKDRDGNLFAVWTYNLNSSSAAFAGQLRVQFYAITSAATISSALFKINVLPGVPRLLPAAPEEADYLAIKQAFTSIVEKVYDIRFVPATGWVLSYYESDKTATVTGYTGSATDEIRIPPYVLFNGQYYTVTKFAPTGNISALNGVTKISFPETLSVIGSESGDNSLKYLNSTLEDVIIPESVTTLNGTCLPTNTNRLFFNGLCPTFNAATNENRPINYTDNQNRIIVVKGGGSLTDYAAYESLFNYEPANNYLVLAPTLADDKAFFVPNGIFSAGDGNIEMYGKGDFILREGNLYVQKRNGNGGNAEIEGKIIADSIETAKSVYSTADSGEIGFTTNGANFTSNSGDFKSQYGAGEFHNLRIKKRYSGDTGGNAEIDGNLIVKNRNVLNDIDSKQNILTLDNVPIENSSNPVKSGGVYSAIREYSLPLTAKYGASLSLTINNSTYVLTAQLKDQNGDDLGTAQTVDLPLESVVVSGAYDEITKKVILTLQNGSTIEFSVADLISGLQSEITAQNPLSADLVDDTNTTNKFVTASEKTTWDNKQDAVPTITLTQSMITGYGGYDYPNTTNSNDWIRFNIGQANQYLVSDNYDTIKLDIRQIKALLNLPTDYVWIKRNATNSQDYNGTTITLYQFFVAYDGFEYEGLLDPTNPYVAILQNGSAGFIYNADYGLAWLTFRNFNITDIYSRIYEVEVGKIDSGTLSLSFFNNLY